MIMISEPMLWQGSTKQFAKPALDPIAYHCIANLLGHGDAIALTRTLIGIRQKDKARARDSQAAIGGKKVRALAYDVEIPGHGLSDTTTGPLMGARKADWPIVCIYEKAHPAGRAQIKLCAKVFAATIAACTQNLATTRSGLASEEAMTALTHEIAGRECPLHIILKITNGAHKRGCETPIKRAACVGDRISSARLGEGSL